MGPRDTWDKMAEWLRGLASTLDQKPRAILVVSAHWETPEFTVMTQERPGLLFDYYGFPEHTYQLTYPAPGAPDVAQRIQALLGEQGISVRTDGERNFDHGVFVPFRLIYPDADIPVLQISLKNDLDPETHLRLGRALAPLRNEGILIVGSGMSYHNLREFFGGRSAGEVSESFDRWLTHSVTELSGEARSEALNNWSKAPHARLAHPREEHLIPLHVVAGAAEQEPGTRVFSDRIMGAIVSGYRFGT